MQTADSGPHKAVDWVKLLTEFDGNPKVLSVGLAGAGLYARSLCYCGKYETDGFIPDSWVHQAVGYEGLKHLPKQLLGVGLWELEENDPTGYRIKDYTAVNKSKKEMEKLRANRSRAGKRGGKAKPQASVKQKESKSPSYSYAVSFSSWIEHYKATTGQKQTRGSSPARKAFGARLDDGYSLEDLKLATVGAHSDEFLRKNGHVVPDTILRASKVDRYIQMGREADKDDPLAIITGRAA